MYKIDKEAFKRYFFWGIDNPEAVLEGIMFFTYAKQPSKEEEKKTEEEIIDSFVQKVKPLYKQYYRFIELNNKSNVSNYKKENEEELEKKIRNKIEELRNDVDEEITEEMIEREIERQKERIEREMNKGADWEKYYWRQQALIMPEKVREQMEIRGKKKLSIEDNRISYSIPQIAKYAFIPEGTRLEDIQKGKYMEYAEYRKEDWKCEQIPKDLGEWGQELQTQPEERKYIPNELRHWTQMVAEILQTLEEIEQKDPNAYKDLWLRTRKNRAKNGTIQGITQEEITKIEDMCSELRQLRLKEEQKREEESYGLE